MNNDPTKPLAGIRVVDLTRMLAGPCCAELLADLGATVIKIEEPRIGDPTRRNLPRWGEESAYFMALNRGKQSIAVDLKDPEGMGIFDRLVEDADVVLENFRPGVMDKLGIGPQELARRNQGLVFCSISGFGATGPLREKISFDLVNQAMAGFIDSTGEPEGKSARAGVPIGDMGAGLYATIAILAGLAHKQRTGLGCWIDISLHDVLISLLGQMAEPYFLQGTPPSRMGSRHPILAPHGTVPVTDGWVALAACDEDQWRGLCAAVGLDVADPRFLDNEARKAHERELEEVLAAATSGATADELVKCLDAHGVPAAKVLSVGGALESAEVTGTGLIYDVASGDGQEKRFLAAPIVMGGRHAGLGAIPPLHGESTGDLMRELGYTDDQIAALAERSVVRVLDPVPGDPAMRE